MRQGDTTWRASMKTIHLPGDGAFVRYIEVPGDDPPLLWLHGWQCSSTGELMPAAVQAPLRGRRSLLVDLLGHGYSDKPPDFGYRLEDHARTIVTVIDLLGLRECGLVGHSMGGAVGVHVAAARPEIVSLLIMAEGAIDADGEAVLDGQSEDAFAADGFRELLESQAREAEAQPAGLRAAHLGITRLVDPRALHREAVSLEGGTEPSVRSVLGELRMPRWYLQGELSRSGTRPPAFPRGIGCRVEGRPGDRPRDGIAESGRSRADHRRGAGCVLASVTVQRRRDGSAGWERPRFEVCRLGRARPRLRPGPPDRWSQEGWSPLRCASSTTQPRGRCATAD